MCKLPSACAQLSSGRLRGPQEVLEDLGYETDWAIWNVKMVLGVISCVCAGVAQLWPGEYPETKIVLMVCCGIYYAAAVWLQYIASFQECGWFVFTQPKPTAKWSTTAGIALTSTMERYEYEYTLSVEVRPGSDTQLPVRRRSPLATSLPLLPPKDLGEAWSEVWIRACCCVVAQEGQTVQLVKGLNDYFDTEGYLAHEIFEKDIERLIGQFEKVMAPPKPKLDDNDDKED